MNYNDVNLIAPVSFWEATKEEIDEHTNGCGPGRYGNYLVPNKILGISIIEACRIHDWEYYLGEILEDKEQADFNFLLNMLEINYKRSKCKILRFIRDHIIFYYFISVCYYGDLFLNKN